MEKSAIIQPYVDLKNKGSHDTAFFFLHHILKARADLHLESGKNEHDQEVNVYISGLMNSLVDSEAFLHTREYISIFDVDVRRYLDDHPGARNEYVVYRDNADFGLLLQGVFLGFVHQGSYQRIVMPDADPGDRIALYYDLAASALAHLQGAHGPLIPVFTSIAEHLGEVVQILRRAAGYYFEIMEKISEGSMYHLERGLSDMGSTKIYQIRLDEFLKIYAEYKATPTEERKRRLLSLADELSIMNERFKFDELSA
jgi:hypothetical protein